MGPILLEGNFLPIFPCLANKKPASRHGFKDATADPAAIRELWRSHWGPLVGLSTGERSGLDVLDIDLDGLSWFRRNSGRLPLTRMHETRSGGRHLFFRHRLGLRCSTSKIARGVDVRADGGYVIWWPATSGPVLCEGDRRFTAVDFRGADGTQTEARRRGRMRTVRVKSAFGAQPGASLSLPDAKSHTTYATYPSRRGECSGRCSQRPSLLGSVPVQ
jgi:hypothetical protein